MRAASGVSSRELGSSELGHDVLDACILLEAIRAQVLAVAALLEAPMRHLRHQGNVRVDPHAPKVKRPGAAQGLAVISGPHTAREAVLDAIRGRYLHSHTRTHTRVEYERLECPLERGNRAR